MVPRVVADHHPHPLLPANDVGEALDEVADREERRPDVEAVQDRQDPWRVDRVGPVVEGQGDRARLAERAGRLEQRRHQLARDLPGRDDLLAGRGPQVELWVLGVAAGEPDDPPGERLHLVRVAHDPDPIAVGQHPPAGCWQVVQEDPTGERAPAQDPALDVEEAAGMRPEVQPGERLPERRPPVEEDRLLAPDEHLDGGREVAHLGRRQERDGEGHHHHDDLQAEQRSEPRVHGSFLIRDDPRPSRVPARKREFRQGRRTIRRTAGLCIATPNGRRSIPSGMCR